MNEHINKCVTLLGFPVSKKSSMAIKDDKMVFYSFEDTRAIYDATLSPKVYAEHKDLIVSQHPCFIHGKVESEFGPETLMVIWIKKIK